MRELLIVDQIPFWLPCFIETSVIFVKAPAHVNIVSQPIISVENCNSPEIEEVNETYMLYESYNKKTFTMIPTRYKIPEEVNSECKRPFLCFAKKGEGS